MRKAKFTPAHARKYQQILREVRLYDRGLASLVFALGRPVLTDQAETAQVSFAAAPDNPDDPAKILLEVNDQLFEDMTGPSVAFMLAHECLHVAWRHLFELMFEKGKYPRRNILELAHEVVINDYLIGSHHMEPPTTPEDNTVIGIFGPEKFEFSFDGFDTAGAYQKIIEILDEKQQKSEATEQDMEDHLNDLLEDACQPPENLEEITSDDLSDILQGWLQDALNDATKGGNPTPESLSNIINKHNQDAPPENTITYDGPLTNSITASKNLEKQATLNWARILKEINPRILSGNTISRGPGASKRTFSRLNVPTVAQYPQMVLPGRHSLGGKSTGRGNEVPTIILALDFSYSVASTTTLEMIVSLAESIPSAGARVIPVTWADDVVPWNPEERQVANGGTDIYKVLQYANNIMEENGSAPYVIVVSDGQFYCDFENHSTVPFEHYFWVGFTPDDKRCFKRALGEVAMKRYYELDSLTRKNSGRGKRNGAPVASR